MRDSIHQLQKRADVIRHTLANISTKQLNIAKTKEEVRTFVYDYFKEFRPAYIAAERLETDLEKADSTMQELLRYTQRRTLVSAYKYILKDISAALHELELKSIASIIDAKSDISDNKQDRQILDTLEKINPSAALSYSQALRDLQDRDRKSWRGTAVEFRESLRELLDTMAPDDEVKAQPSFKLEQDTKGPTMKQKAIFILKSRRAFGKQIKVFTDAVEVVEELVGKFVRSVYERSCVATHTPTSRDEVLKIRNFITVALVELLEIKV